MLFAAASDISYFVQLTVCVKALSGIWGACAERPGLFLCQIELYVPE